MSSKSCLGGLRLGKDLRARFGVGGETREGEEEEEEVTMDGGQKVEEGRGGVEPFRGGGFLSPNSSAAAFCGSDIGEGDLESVDE